MQSKVKGPGKGKSLIPKWANGKVSLLFTQQWQTGIPCLPKEFKRANYLKVYHIHRKSTGNSHRGHPANTTGLTQ